MTIIFPGAGPAAALSPEAWEVLDHLDRRIAAAEAGQASRDAFLELSAEAPGCRDWSGFVRSARARRDPALREALLEACPELAGPPATRPRSPRSRSGLRGRLRAHQSVQPQSETAPDLPTLDVALQGPLPAISLAAGAEASAAESEWRRRRVWLAGNSLSLQAGQLQFGPGAATLPRLDFVSGRRGFPGSGVTSGVEGPWQSRSSALDGLGGAWFAGPWRAGAFAAWNRLRLPGNLRGDAVAYSLSAEGAATPWTLALQALDARLEPAGGAAIPIRVAGAELSHASGWRAGGAAMAPGPARNGLPGAFGEVSWEGGDSGRHLLELRQASQGWAHPLAAAPALRWDTLPDGWRLPGRSEGGFAGRSRFDLLEAEGFAAWAVAEGEAAWQASADGRQDGLLAGEGRFALACRAGSFAARTGAALGWRREGLSGAGALRSWSQGIHWEGRGWRLRGSVSRRRQGDNDQENWPFSLEASGRRRETGSWRAAWSSADLAEAGRNHRLSLGQSWRLGGSLAVTQTLRLPFSGLRAAAGIAYGLGLEYAGR